MWNYAIPLKARNRISRVCVRAWIVLALLVGIMLSSCRKFEYSPYQYENDERPKALNQKRIEELRLREPNGDDTVKIILTGDTHRFYDQLSHFVEEANKIPGLDFVAVAGDMTDFGIIEQYMTINDELSRLRVPVFCAVGNHDLIGAGSEIYSQMYGEKNFSFTYRRYKFLFHDTNGREYNFNGSVPNLWWLSDQMNDSSVNWIIGVSHVPPYNEDFDKTVELPYHHLLRSDPRFILSLHGHVHYANDAYWYQDAVRYITCNSMDKQRSTLITLVNGVATRELLNF
jgi:Icc-related predicted phosphoesterase